MSLTVLVALGALASQDSGTRLPSFEERLLATIEEGANLKKGPADFGDPVVFSCDGRSVAYRAEKDGKTFVVVGDDKGPKYL